MVKFFIWLNDTTFQRNYWSQKAQNWTVEFSEATLFDKDTDAEIEQGYAEKTTKAEVIVQEIVVN